MKENKIHITELTSIITGRFCTQSIDQIYSALNYLLSDDIFTHQIPRAIRCVQPFLLNNFPIFVKRSKDIEDLINSLPSKLFKEELFEEDNTKHKNKCFTEFTASLVEITGLDENIEIDKLPEGRWERINIFDELSPTFIRGATSD